MSYLMAILSGLLATIPLKYNNLFFLGWIFILPLLFTMNRDEPGDTFIRGWVAGISLMTGTAYWLYYPLNDFSGFPTPVVILVLALLLIILGSFYGLWALLFSYLNSSSIIHPVLLAISWTGMEYIRFKVLSIFPLGFQAYTQTGFSSLVQLADTGGVFLITFLVLLINGYIYKLIKHKKIRYLIPVILILLLVLVTGRAKYNQYQQKDYDHLKLGIINTSIPQKEKWLPSRIESGMEMITSAALEMEEEDVDLVITPETILTFDLIRNEHYRDIFLEQIQPLTTPIMIGSQAIHEGERGRYNSVFLLSPQGEILTRYDKNILVIGGEYIPFSDVINRYSGLNLNSIRPGEGQTIFEIPPVSWGALICSEILYPRYSQNISQKVDFIVNQSNEAWFKNSNINQQMWSAAIFRAIENRRSVVKAGNSAISGLISPSGKVVVKVADTSNYTGLIKINDSDPTFYQKWGDWPGIGAAVILLLMLTVKAGYLVKEAMMAGN